MDPALDAFYKKFVRPNAAAEMIGADPAKAMGHARGGPLVSPTGYVQDEMAGTNRPFTAEINRPRAKLGGSDRVSILHGMPAADDPDAAIATRMVGTSKPYSNPLLAMLGR